MVVEDDPGGRGKPREGIAGAQERATANREPDIAQPFERRREGDPGRIIGAEHGGSR